jgi:hypothetical protein
VFEKPIYTAGSDLSITQNFREPGESEQRETALQPEQEELRGEPQSTAIALLYVTRKPSTIFANVC